MNADKDMHAWFHDMKSSSDALLVNDYTEGLPKALIADLGGVHARLPLIRVAI
jgi:hypothetical protein